MRIAVPLVIARRRPGADEAISGIRTRGIASSPFRLLAMTAGLALATMGVTFAAWIASLGPPPLGDGVTFEKIAGWPNAAAVPLVVLIATSWLVK